MICGDYQADISLRVKVMLTLVLCCLLYVTMCRNLTKLHVM